MSDEEIIIYDYLLSRRGVYHSVREVSKALDHQRAKTDHRWAHFSLKKLEARCKIERSEEGYYFVPKTKVEEEEGLHLAAPGDARRGGVRPGLAPQTDGRDTPGLAETETMFLEKSAAEKERAKALSETKPAPDPVVPLTREGNPPETGSDKAGDAIPRVKPNPSANIAVGRKLKGLPRLGSPPPGK